MSLADWLNEGKLKSHRTRKNEINQLISVYERDLKDALVINLSTDRRFATAYNAALMITIAALAAGANHHYWSIQSLAFTLQPDVQTIKKFDNFRRKRNISDYERIGMVSEREVSEVIDLAKNLKTMLDQWLPENHPELI